MNVNNKSLFDEASTEVRVFNYKCSYITRTSGFCVCGNISVSDANNHLMFVAKYTSARII